VSVPVIAIALLNARREYRQRGRLSVMGLTLICLMFLVPNLMLEFATKYEWPSSLLDYIGLLIGLTGLVLLIVGMTAFRSGSKILCLNSGQLTVSGPYRWSRNPQYLGYFLFLLGFSLNDWSVWCLAAIVVAAVALHLLILVEEEHLLRVHGEQYAEFRARTPRYAGWGI
jgi:protein-S-isoprenylcysteine O-methyltransferase Ste14